MPGKPPSLPASSLGCWLATLRAVGQAQEGSCLRSVGPAGQQSALSQPWEFLFLLEPLSRALQPGCSSFCSWGLQKQAHQCPLRDTRPWRVGGCQVAFSVSAMPAFPLDNHCSCLSDLGCEWSRPSPGSRGSTLSRPDSLCASHSSGHKNGWVQGWGVRDTETFAGNAGPGSFPLSLVPRR